MFEKKTDPKKIVAVLNRILEAELAGVVRYTHYSFMVFGHSRLPIVSWLRGQASESLTHAHEAGELLTMMGEHPSLGIGPLLETYKHEIGEILAESREHERGAVALYRDLLKQVEGKSVLLEEYARTMVADEVRHLAEVDKMLRKPGDIGGPAPLPAPRPAPKRSRRR
jgi:bacterioferritin